MDALVWANSGPGVMDVPDSLPAVVVQRTMTYRRSNRGETFAKLEERPFYRQLYAAPLTRYDAATQQALANLEFEQWAAWPAARIVASESDPERPPAPVLLMVIYTEWQP